MSSFDFLHHMEDQQLLDVLKDEDDRSKALVISHLSDERKSRLLQELGLEEAGRVLFCMSQIRYMVFHDYEKIAKRLFDKSYRLQDSGQVIQDKDIDQIVSIIEALPVSDQEKYIQQLDLMVSDLADAVRERVITMERIADLEDEILEEAIDAMSRKDLAIALVGSEEALRTRLLKFRPKKEEEAIREEIEEMVFLSRDEIDQYRRKLLQKLRETCDKRKSNVKTGPVKEGATL